MCPMFKYLAWTPYIGWVCCWFSPLLLEVFLRVLRFSLSSKSIFFQFPIRPGIRKTKNHSVVVLPPKSLFIYLFICLINYLHPLTAQPTVVFDIFWTPETPSTVEPKQMLSAKSLEPFLPCTVTSVRKVFLPEGYKQGNLKAVSYKCFARKLTYFLISMWNKTLIFMVRL